MKNRSVSFRMVALLLIGPAVFAVSLFQAAAFGADVQYSGEVVKVDTGAQQVVVKNPQSGGRIRFTVTAKTAISSGNDKKSLGDLRPGNAVDVEYVMEGDKYVANKVMLKPSSGK
ncbi:MAG: hypothetical protein HY283_03440 [Nitrospirae bacterium]|nr:hypothetical protein [Nitrospirota bacterium]